MNSQWEYSAYEDPPGPCWTLSSPYHDGGVPFRWKITITGAGRFSLGESTPELISDGGADHTFQTIDEAVLHCEKGNIEIEEDLKKETANMASPVNRSDELKFTNAFNKLAISMNVNATKHGWWDKEHRNDGEKIALMHSELSEALEALRNGVTKSEHIPIFSGVEEELADVIIRIMDFGMRKNLNVSGAIIAKMKFNESRPHKHGGKKF